MLNTIWKFPIEVADSQKISIPYHHKILCVQVQNGVPCIWAEVDTYTPTVEIEVLVYGTGHEINPPGKRLAQYVGTFQLMDGRFVGHVYVRE